MTSQPSPGTGTALAHEPSQSGGIEPTRRPARRDPGRKERIVRAALEVLAEHGVAGTTHRMVAEAADVPLGSLTYYFTSLADLRAQAFQLLATEMSARYSAAFDAVTSRADLIKSLTALIEDQAGAQKREMVLSYELYLAAMRDPDLRTITESWMQSSRRVLERYVDPVTARGVDALIEGLVMHNALATAPLARRDIATIVTAMISNSQPEAPANTETDS